MKIIKYNKLGALLCLSLCLFVVSFGAVRPAHALLLTDTFIFISERGNSTDFRMKNITKKPQAYRLSWLQMRMLPDGARQLVKEGEVLSHVNDGAPYLYMSPRRMVLQPDQLQHIRFMVRRKKDMPAGEYRSYIYLQPEEMPEPLTAKNMQAKKNNVASAQLNVLTGYRLPVFFLHGETTLNAAFSDIHKEQRNKKDAIVFTLNRQGTRSALGEIKILCNDGTETRTQLAKFEMKIFTDIDKREFYNNIDFDSIACQAIDLEFTPHEQDPLYTGAPIATARFPLR